MKAISRRRDAGRAARRRGDESRFSDAGDTLIELLVAVSIIGLSVAAVLGGLASALGSSGTHRSLTNLDAILRSYAEIARYDIQLRPANQGAPLFRPCVAASSYLVVSAPYPASGSAGTAVTVFGSGFTGPTGSQTAAVTDSRSVTRTVPAAIQLTAAGNFTATFVLPAGLNSGPATVRIIDGSNTAPTASSFDVDPSVPAASGSPLAGYQIGLTGTEYWNGTTFQPTCDTSSPDDQLQQITVSGTAPGASDQLMIVVADSNYVFPPPQVVRTFIGQNGAPGAGYGYLADGARYTIYADVIEPDGLPGIASVTADVSGISAGQTAVTLSPVGTRTAPNGQAYNYASVAVPLTAGSPGDGTTVTYTVNATDTAGLPSQYSGNGTVTFDTNGPSGSVSVTNGSGFITSLPVQGSFSATDSESGVDAGSGQLVELSAPLANGTCQGSPGNPITVATGLGLPQTDPMAVSGSWTDPMAVSGKCYQYQYTVSDNVGNPSATFTSGIPVKVDTVPPSLAPLQFSSETNASVAGTTVTFGASAPGGASFTVTASATDPVWSTLTYRFNGTPSGWTATGSGNTRTYKSTPGASGGTIRVTVRNGAGLQTSTTFTLLADTSAPTGSASVANTNGYVTSPPVVTFSSTPDTYGPDSTGGQLFQLSAPLSGGTCQGSFGNAIQVGTNGLPSPYTDTSVTTGNCYEYQYVIADSLGNQGTFTSNPVMFDTTPPSVSITYPVDGSTYTSATGQSDTWTGTITGTASDSASTLSNIGIAIEDTTTGKWWDGTTFSLASPPPGAPASGTSSWTYALPVNALVDGDQYQVVAQAVDAAGLNSTTTASFTG